MQNRNKKLEFTGAFDKATPCTYGSKPRKQFERPVSKLSYTTRESATSPEQCARRKEERSNFTKEALADMAAHWASIGTGKGTGGAGFTRETGIEKYEDRECLSARLQRFHSTSSDQLFPKYREPWLQHPTTDHVKGGNHARCQGAAHALQLVSAVTSLVVPVQNLRSSTFSALLTPLRHCDHPGQVGHDAGGGKWGRAVQDDGPAFERG